MENSHDFRGDTFTSAGSHVCSGLMGFTYRTQSQGARDGTCTQPRGLWSA